MNHQPPTNHGCSIQEHRTPPASSVNRRIPRFHQLTVRRTPVRACNGRQVRRCGTVPVVSTPGGCGAPTDPILKRLQIVNENAEPVSRVFINIGKSHREPHPAHRIDHCSLKSDISNGQRNSDVFNDCSFRRCRETAIDITAGRAEAADTRFLLTPRTEPRAIEMAFDSLSLLPATVASRAKRSSPEPRHGYSS